MRANLGGLVCKMRKKGVAEGEARICMVHVSQIQVHRHRGAQKVPCTGHPKSRAFRDNTCSSAIHLQCYFLTIPIRNYAIASTVPSYGLYG